MATKPAKTTKSTKPALEVVKAAEPIASPPMVDDSDDLTDIEPMDPRAAAYKMKDLMAAVVTKTGAKKKDAKDVVDAALGEIAAALAAGKSLALPPLGNLRVAKTMEKAGATMMVLRLRLGGGAGSKDAKQALAEDGDDS